MDAGRERWLLTLELPEGVPNPGQFVARVLKHLLRTWAFEERRHATME
jgi:hypothetical protein